jgi:hypothetical protein
MSAAPHVLANDWHYPLLNLFWTMLWLFLWILWFFLLFRVILDIFRSDTNGWGKAGWLIFVIILPFLGVFVYLIARGGDMYKRDAVQAQQADDAMRTYIKSAAGSSSSSADELTKLADLHQRGVLTDAEFESQKAKLLA